jgi:hypothetical protein
MFLLNKIKFVCVYTDINFVYWVSTQVRNKYQMAILHVGITTE